MPSDCHSDDLGDASIQHVAGSSAAKIVEQPMRHICSFAGHCPRLAEVADRLTVVVKHIPRKSLAAAFVLDSLRFAATFDDGGQFAF